MDKIENKKHARLFGTIPLAGGLPPKLDYVKAWTEPGNIEPSNDIPKIVVAFLASQNAPVNSACRMEWAELAAMLGDVKISNSKDGLAWMPAEIEPGARNGDRVKGVTMLVLDVEANASRDPATDIKTVTGQEPPATDEIAAELALSGYACILHTSYHHHDAAILPSDQLHPRYRLVFPVSRPLAKEEIKPLALHVAVLLGLSDCVDTSCMEPARLFFLPRCPAERIDDFRHEVIEGVPLDVDALLNDAHRVEDALKDASKKPRAKKTGGVIDAFNNTYEPGAILEQHGYKSMRNRWMHPNSTTGMPGVRSLPDTSPERVYSSHSNDPLNDGHAHDAFDCFRILKHGGDIKAAVKKAAHMLGIQSQKSVPPGSDFSSSNVVGVVVPPNDENVELQREIDALAAMPLLKYEREYKEAAKRLGMRAAVLDSAVKAARSGDSENTTAMFPAVEPWPSHVEAAALFSELSEAFRRYAVLPKHADVALALWCVFTWFCEASHIAPLLVIRSPEKGCGKSTVMNILARLVHRALILSGLSAAVLFRVADRHKPTWLIDEGDTFLNNENEELHGVINSGYSRTAPYHWRCVGDNHEPKAFNVFSPKAIAFIGHTRDTLHDRAVEVELRRKLPHEKVARLRHGDGEELSILARKLARLAADRMVDYNAQRPQIPESLPDRQADNWEPLLQVAMLAGDEWVQLALKAALALTGSKAESAPVSVGVELLADIQQIFQTKGISRIRSTDLIQALCDDEEAGWATYNRGKPITPRQVSKRLVEFGIKPKTIRLKTETPKGFELSQFADPFERYLATPQNMPQHPQQTPEANRYAALTVADTPPQKITGNNAATLKAPQSLGCGGVADKTPISWEARPKVSILGANI